MRVSNHLLTDTYHLIQLAREAALAQGNAERAERLSPIAEELRSLLHKTHETTSNPPSGILAGSDFRTLLNVVNHQPTTPIPNSTGNERYQTVLAMAAANMNETNIARQLGMTIEEVRTIIQIAQKRSSINIMEGGR